MLQQEPLDNRMNTLPTPSPEAALAWDAAHLANENLTVVSNAEANIIGACALQQIECVGFTEGSFDKLVDLLTKAEEKFKIARSMVPDLRQEGLTNDPVFSIHGKNTANETDRT